MTNSVAIAAHFNTRSEDELLEVLPGPGAPKYGPIEAIAFHTRSTSKFYGDDYAVESA